MPLDEAYLEWLYSQVGSTKSMNLTRTYWKLLGVLYSKEFTWERIEKDENRAKDGKDLRQEFLRATHASADNGWLDMPCSFLELMIALSFKLAWEAGGESADWFWILVENLGLIECNDANPPDETIVNHILDKVIERDYSPNGAGGLFPLAEPTTDQRDVELWYQAQTYLLERL